MRTICGASGGIYADFTQGTQNRLPITPHDTPDHVNAHSASVKLLHQRQELAR
jgi:hypothetical protein